MNKYMVSAGVAASLLAGSVALSAVNPLTFAGAQDTTAPTEQAPAETPPDAGAERVKPLDAALDELVADGTISQEQADAVAARTKEKRDALGDEGGGRGGPGHGRGGPGGHFGGIGEAIDGIAGQLGITADELKEALQGGSSLNDLATEHGVDPAAISQAIIDAANTRIDGALADGKITQEQADEAKAKISENIAGIMDGSLKGPGRGGEKPPAGDEPPAEEAPADGGGA